MKNVTVDLDALDLTTLTRLGAVLGAQWLGTDDWRHGKDALQQADQIREWIVGKLGEQTGVHDQLSGRLLAMETERDGLTRKLSEMQKQLQYVSDERTNLRHALDGANQRERDMGNGIDSLNHDLNYARQGLEEQKRVIDAMAQKVVALMTERDDLKARLAHEVTRDVPDVGQREPEIPPRLLVMVSVPMTDVIGTVADQLPDGWGVEKVEVEQ